MATSALPAIIDYWVGWCRSAPQFAAPVVVSDGWPVSGGDLGITIGITPRDEDTNGGNVHAELGAQSQWEEYDIPCLISSYVGGGEEAMKTARDRAFVLVDAIDTQLRTVAGRTCGGAVHSGSALIQAVTVRQVADFVDVGGELVPGQGRRCDIEFMIHFKSRSAA